MLIHTKVQNNPRNGSLATHKWKTITNPKNRGSHNMKFKREGMERRKTKGNGVESLQNLQSPLESPQNYQTLAKSCLQESPKRA